MSPASPPPSGRPGSPRPPRARRPTGATLDALERDGISWSGAVDIVGHEGNIPAILYVTSHRVVLADGDAILLEVPRSWLLPAPLCVEERGVRLSITPEGIVPGPGTTERLLLLVGDGRGPANQLIAILTGRARRERIEAELPVWKPGVGAGRASALPSLPAFETAQDAPRRRSRETGDPEIRGVAPIDQWDAPRQPAPVARLRAPEPEPAEPQSHAARFLTSRQAAAPPSATAPKRPPAEVTPATRRGGAGAWIARVALLAIIAIAAGWFARPYLPEDVTNRLPAAIVGERAGEGDDVALQRQAAPLPTSDAEQGDGTDGASSSPADIMPTEVALGVGGATSDIAAGGGEHGPEGSVLPTPTPPVGTGGEPSGAAPAQVGGEDLAGAPPDTSGAPAGTQPAESGEEPAGDEDAAPPVATDAPQPTEPPTDLVPTLAPTEPPAVETAAPIETEAPTVAPTVAPTQIPTQAPTSAPTEEPTVIPATPTVAAEGTPAPTVAPTEEPAAKPTLESQPASVDPQEPPAQEFVEDGIRYSVEGASTGSSVPELPEINAVTYGEWIVLSVEGQNLTGENQVFDMRQFSLVADGQPIQLDVGNSWVASLLGYAPAYGNTDAILWAPGEEHRFALTFLAPLGAQSLVLLAGDQQLDLGSILETTPALGQMRQTAAPETIDATVVDVVDGETIVIEKDGIQQTVRYLGIDVPTGDACYAEEATEANRALVAGKPVKIERQATDVDARGNWVRDVWVEQEDGRYALVAHQLVQEGAAMADISQPNTRFATWLRSADAAAHAEGRGLWGGCAEGSAPAADTVIARPVDAARRVTA